MPLNAANMVLNGHLTSTDIRNFYDLFTGVMTDQAVHFANDLTVDGITYLGETLQWLVDDGYDIGHPSTFRPRNIFAAGALATGLKAGVPVDTDVVAPTDGMLRLDSATDTLYFRSSGAWHATAAGGDVGATISVFEQAGVVGSTVTLPVTPPPNAVFEVMLNGQGLMAGRDWTINGAIITFATPLALPADVYVSYLTAAAGAPSPGPGGAVSVYEQQHVTGTTVTLPVSPPAGGVFAVAVNGQQLIGGRDWSVFGSTVTFSTPLSADDVSVSYVVNQASAPPLVLSQANLLTNGGFEIWQRGNGPFTSGWAADRWFISIGGTSTLSVSSNTANADGGGTCAACTYTHNAETFLAGPLIEPAAQLRGKIVSASVRVRTSTTNAVRIRLQSYNGSAYAFSYSAYHSGGGAYETLIVTQAVQSDSTQVFVHVSFNASCTAYLDNAMLVVGSTPADYVPLHPADDLARCQRYYETFQANAGAPMWLLHGIGTSALNGPFVPYTMQKAVTPSVTFNTTFIVILGNGGAITVTSVGTGQTVDGYRISAAAAVANGTTYLCYPNSAPATGIMASEANP